MRLEMHVNMCCNFVFQNPILAINVEEVHELLNPNVFVNGIPAIIASNSFFIGRDF